MAEAMNQFINEIGANPGRSGHLLSNMAEGVRNDAREAVAAVFGAMDPLKSFSH